MNDLRTLLAAEGLVASKADKGLERKLQKAQGWEPDSAGTYKVFLGDPDDDDTEILLVNARDISGDDDLIEVEVGYDGDTAWVSRKVVEKATGRSKKLASAPAAPTNKLAQILAEEGLTRVARLDSRILRMFPARSFLRRFFEEKEIPHKVFKVRDSQGLTHDIPNEVVIEHIAGTSPSEQRQIEGILRKIDFHAGDVNHFLEHLAKALAEQYGGAMRFAADREVLVRVASSLPKGSVERRSVLAALTEG